DTKIIAESNRLEIFCTPPSAKDLSNWKVPTDKQYDLGVVVSFGYFIPPHIISAFKYGAVNVHPSLLPKYRGAAPIQHAIMYGDSETGVSVQELDDKEFDAGRILTQEKVVTIILTYDLCKKKKKTNIFFF
ncbi:formyl transferase, partial [Pilaira anomala]